jgi:hypothetical protein
VRQALGAALFLCEPGPGVAGRWFEPAVSPQDPTISRPISRSSRACAAQSAAARTMGWPGLLARVDLISNRTAAALGRSWSRSHSNLRFAKRYLPGGPILWRTFSQLVEVPKTTGAPGRKLR